MLDNPRNLPFAMYDIAVYLPGGAVTLLALEELAKKSEVVHLHFAVAPNGETAIEQIILGVVWLSASYLIGHVAAFISSYLIEKFVHYSLGYPSDIWLKSEQSLSHGEPRKAIFRKIFQRNLAAYPSYWVPRLIKLAQLPALLPLLAVKIAHPYGFYNHKLPHGILPDVKKKFDSLHISVKIKEGSRWEKVVEHFIASNCMPAYTRMYNYLVIYGALRMLAVLLLGYLWFLLSFDISLKVSYGWQFWRDVNFDATIYYISISAVYVLCVMAFAKFNRRYFEESILAFLLATSDELEKP